MKVKNNEIRKPIVDLIPLMDSMFLILVFFIFAMLSMVVHRGVPLDIPEAVSAVTNQDPFTTISVSPAGKIYYEEIPMSLEQLSATLSQLIASGKEPKLYISADRSAQFGMVLKVLDLCRQLEISQVSFETGTQNEI